MAGMGAWGTADGPSGALERSILTLRGHSDPIRPDCPFWRLIWVL